MTDDQRRAALHEEMSRYARIVEWRRFRRLWWGDERPDPVTIVAKARMNAAQGMLEAIRRADRIDPDIPF